jgi:S-adenosylmethionine hydrolase
LDELTLKNINNLPMAIITLTTDFGEKDHFTGATKGAIYSELPNVTIVDISHNVRPFNVPEAAYIIENAYRSFPKGTIHIIGIDSELNVENKHIAMLLDDHYFICANNGIMSMICSEIAPSKIVEINIHDKMQTCFTVLDVFVKVACHIARGGKLEVVGKPINSIKPINNLKPYVNEERTKIIGRVIYIDNYGNVITNVRKSFFETVQKGRKFEITARQYKFKTIYNKYCDFINFDIPKADRQDEGKGIVLFNSGGFLEIAMYKSDSNTHGSAATLMGFQVRDTIGIDFIKAPSKPPNETIYFNT